MMMKAFPAVLFLCCIANFKILAQDTIPAAPTAKPKKLFIFGLNITQTFTGLLHPTATIPNGDPYQFTFRVGNEKTRWRNGINFNNKKVETEDPFQGSRITRTNGFDLRSGVERNYTVSDRFDFYWGIDWIFGWNRNKITTNVGGGISNLNFTSTKLGLGPVTGIVFHLHPRVTLSTECSVYGYYIWNKSKIKAFPDISDDSTSEGNFTPVLPTSLFINYTF